ncbi:hypothetical protein [Gluconobacter cerinus]|uniref:hypothetical protein n=1 Tax=Gluconobacter cerinus TaxID=38307 RepID=UPI001B8D89A1|nr:hypothetical protein [Gluconobacter cerinus]MBS1039125.1 hypothetical protein [Gluconobacter cerinus]
MATTCRVYVVDQTLEEYLLKSHDLITSPANIVLKAADQSHTRTTDTNPEYSDLSSW